MPLLSISFDSTVLARLADADGDETVHITLTPGTGAVVAPPPVVPHGALAGLMRAGLLHPGAVLTFDRCRADRFSRAVVTPDGRLAEAATGRPVDGWTLWRLSDGRTLDDLRRGRRAV
ncbi:DUF4357 domain-containing protein [Streptomyces caatingaensis]|uniref:RAMA domain-containing protein n=1 Tax=Streptomyces caatingaensis TaxID=1678637 RepID=A0A0K9XLL3_9ACTN|nr:DUF4357 domain-containing protein [Streptomyces caatingaensis]KNB54138.1 hypothetical protein AC230_06385 [Streptomyces caatingaensis]